jgi:predicted kinase
MNGPACSGKTTLARQLQSALCLQFARRAPATLSRTHAARVWHIECDFLEQQVRTGKANQSAQPHQAWSRESWKTAQKLALETTRAIVTGVERCPNYNELTRLVSVHVSCNDDLCSDDLFNSGGLSNSGASLDQTFFDIVLVDDNMLKRNSRKKYCAVASENGYVFVQLCLQTPLNVCVARNSVRHKQAMQRFKHGLEKGDYQEEEEEVAETDSDSAQQSLLIPDAVVQDTHTCNEVRRLFIINKSNVTCATFYLIVATFLLDACDLYFVLT